MACAQASRDPDWSAPDWSAPDWSAPDWSAPDWSAPDWSAPDWSGSGFSEKDLSKHSRGPNACFVLGSSVIVCALKILLLFQLISNCCL